MIANLQLSAEQRDALQSHPGEPLHIRDDVTRKVYLLVEEGRLPELGDAYIREGLELAREQIARGEIADRPIREVIAEAQRRTNK